MQIKIHEVQEKREEIKTFLSEHNRCVYIELPNTKDCLSIDRAVQHFAGYIPTDLYTITYLEDDSDNWTCNNSEYVPGRLFDDAFDTLLRRQNDPFNATYNSVALSKFLIKE